MQILTFASLRQTGFLSKVFQANNISLKYKILIRLGGRGISHNVVIRYKRDYIYKSKYKKSKKNKIFKKIVKKTKLNKIQNKKKNEIYYSKNP